jgi:four helix bundle protein
MAEQRGFEDLECYQLALQVMQEAYAVIRRLPPQEKYNLDLQMRKCSVSGVQNIAEGYGRYHYLDSIRFFYISRGSLAETLSAFIVCDTLGYKSGELPRQRDLCHQAIRSLNGYIRYVRSQKQGQQEFGNDPLLRESPPPYLISHDPVENLEGEDDQSTNLSIYPLPGDFA